MHWRGWTIEWRGVSSLVLACVPFLVLAILADVSGRSRALARTGYAMALFLALSDVSLASTYALGFLGGPFRDAALQRADLSLGFSWSAWTGWLFAHPTLRTALAWIYPQVIFSSMAVVVALGMETERGATAFLRAVTLAFSVTLVGMILYPAAGNLPGESSIVARLELQAGTYRHYDMNQAQGIVTMPSFHAILATLGMVGCWPFRWMRWPGVVFNALMLVATITEGGHYLVDILAGIGIAGGAAWLTRMPALRA